MTTDPTADRRNGILFGLAYGDALGRPTEFVKAPTLAKFGNPFREQVGLNRPEQGIVTDDTQMSIYIGRAALEADSNPTPEALTPAFVAHLIAWRNDRRCFDGRRAPGVTCTGAVSDLQKNPRHWQLAARPGSKGNGANMRVAPLALRTDWSWETLAAASQLQAAITHGHPTALAAADLTAVAVRMLLEGFAQPTERLLDHLIAYAYDRREVYYGDWLGHVWEARPQWEPIPVSTHLPSKLMWWEDADPTYVKSVKPQAPRYSAPASPKHYIQRGWDEVIDALLKVYDLPRRPEQDPCEVAGGGWVAEEALAAAVHTLLCFPDNPADALRRAAFTDGDSDSIASITGALAGAAYGRSAFPKRWNGNLEYRSELQSLADRMGNAVRR